MSQININTFQRKSNTIGGFVISIIIFFNFIVPTAIIPRSVFISVFSIIPFILLLNRCLIEKKSIIFIFILFTITIISGTFQNLINLYFIILFQLLIYKYNEGLTINKINRLFIAIGCLSIILQIFYYFITNNSEIERIGLGTDPNFSGLIVLLLFFFLRIIRSKLSLIPVIIAIFLFQSRVLLLSILIYFAIQHLSNTTFNKWLFKIISPFWMILISNILVFTLSFFLITHVTFQKKETSSITDRISNIADQSNFGRLTSNLFWTEKVLSGKYLLKSENLEKNNFDTTSVILPHNSLLNLVISSTTIFGIIYLLYISFLLKPLLNISNLKYFYSFLFYTLFLHGLFNSIYLFPFLLIFLIKPINQFELNNK